MICSLCGGLPGAEEDKGGERSGYGRFPSAMAQVSSTVGLIDTTVLATCAALGVELCLANLYENYGPKLSFVYHLKLGFTELCVCI